MSNYATPVPIVLPPPYPLGTHRQEVVNTSSFNVSLPLPPLAIETTQPIPYEEQPSGSREPTIEEQQRVARQGFFN